MMKFRHRLVALGAAALLAPTGALALGAQVPGAAVATDDAARASGLEEVARIAGPGGTDVEFFSRELSAYKNAADGDLITVEEPVERHFAFVGNQTSGATIVDITDPENPFVAAPIRNCAVGQGDPQVNKDGTLATIAFQTSGTCKTYLAKTVQKGSVIVDLSDVYDPKVIAGAPESQGAHNNSLHPDGRYLYISTSALVGTSLTSTRIPIYDLADPAKPKKVTDFSVPNNGPHDIRFSHDGKRAYLAGISQFYVVNTEDPENPSIISVITPPGGSIGHDTLITRDKRFLFLGDEAGGGATYPCPGGAIYAYDLLDERAPVLLGASWAGGGPVTGRLVDEVPGPTSLGGCTSHVMDLNPDGQSLTIGWYSLGTRIFSFSSFYNADGSPKTAAGIAAAWGKYGVGLVETHYIVPVGANTWSAKQYAKVPGYVFSDDLKLGFYVSKIK